MKLSISGNSPDIDSELKEFIRKKLDQSLGRFASRIRQVSVSLIDLNGPRGGVDKKCRLEAQFVRSGSIDAEVTDTEFEPAAHRAADRLARRIRDLHNRRRTIGRSESAFGPASARPNDDSWVEQHVGSRRMGTQYSETQNMGDKEVDFGFEDAGN
ncbi:MAG: HPF/RaiA family ribosome-associated protein [Phycisphaerae bacterium]